MTNGIPLCMDGLSAGGNRSQAQAFGNRTGSSDVHMFPDLHVIMQKYPQMPPFAPCSSPAAAVTVVPSVWQPPQLGTLAAQLVPACQMCSAAPF